MMRKMISTILLLCLVLGVFSGAVYAAPDYPVLSPDTNTDVLIDTAGQIVYYRFTADHSCVYAFHSISDEDTYGELYAQDGTLLYENDDYYGMNFGIACNLEAGESYILAVSFLDTEVTGSFELVAQTNHDDTIEVIQSPNCNDSGVWHHSCTICGCEWTEIVPPTHDYENGVCTLCGNIMIYNGVCGDGLTWHYDGAKMTLTISGAGAMYDYDEVTPPWQEDDYPVSRVVVDYGVTYIGKNAFANSEMLESVVMSESITTIGDNAFSYCDKLTELVIPQGVSDIGVLAFAYCDQLGAVTIPASVTNLGFGAFQGCRRLESLWVDANSATYSSDEHGVLFNKEKTVLIQAPAAMVGAYEIPESVSVIDDSAFSGCNRLAAVSIPEGVTQIGSGAFSGCGQLMFLQIPATVTDMGEGAISACGNLRVIFFDGDAPNADGVAIEEVSAIAYYSDGNQTWSDDKKATLGEDVEWLPVSGMRILSQPEAWEAIPGETVTLSVCAAGEGLTYTWYMAQPGSGNFAEVDISGNVYELKFTESIVGSRIYCVITDINGNCLQTNTVTLKKINALENDIPVAVNLQNPGFFQYFAYTPAHSCYYVFRSQSVMDTYCELYDSRYILLDSNDDGEDEDFTLRVFLEADTTYILGVRTHGDETGVMDVVVEAKHEFIRSTFL